MIADEFWSWIQDFYEADGGLLERAKLKFIVLGVDEIGIVTDYVNASIVYYRERPSLTVKWEDEQHMINAVIWKAIRLWRDSFKKLNREVKISSNIDEDGESDDEGLIEYLVTQSGIIEERDKFEQGNPSTICEQQDLVEKALKIMTPDQRRAHILLAYGYTRDEIAEKMGISYDAVCKHIQRGSNTARRLL